MTFGVQQAPALRRCTPRRLSVFSFGSSFRKFRFSPVMSVAPIFRCSSSLRFGRCLEPDVAEHRVADVERPQARHLADVGHPRVGDVDAAHDEPAQRAIRAQVRHRRVGQELGRVEREVFELLQRLQLLDAAIGDVGERQVELLDASSARR